jgi:O-antigen ligase
MLPALAVMSALLAIGGMIAFLLGGIAFSADDISDFQYKETPLGLLPRATALMPTTQSLAHLLLLGLSILLFIPIRPVYRALGTALLCIAIGCTFSMGAYVTLVVILLVWPFLRWPARSIHLLVALGALGAVAYFSGAAQLIYDTIVLPVGGKGAQDRIGYLQAGFEAIREHPLFGIGLKGIGRELHTPVHNAYVQLTAELGVLAGVLFVVMILYVTIGAGLAAFVRTSGRQRLGMMGLFLGMIALGVHLMFEPFYDNYTSWAYVGVVAGAIAGLPGARPALGASASPRVLDRAPGRDGRGSRVSGWNGLALEQRGLGGG